MKKQIAILLGLTLLLAGCSGRQEAPESGGETAAQTQAASTQPTETTAPESTLPETAETRVMGEGIPVILDFLKAGETVEVTGYTGDYAKVTLETGAGLVRTDLLRFPDEPFEEFTGYALWNAGLYESFSCLGEPARTLATNTQVTVLEELENCYYVNYDGETGYIPTAQLSRYPYQPPQDGGSAPDASGGGGGSGARDGGDISLRVPGTLRLLAAEEKTGSAGVKVDATPLVLRLCALGDTVRVLDTEAAPEGYTAVLEENEIAYVPTAWLESAQSFTPWEGYAGSNCKLYESFQLMGTPEKTAYVNTKLTVLWTAGPVSLIQLDNTRCYAPTAALSQTPIQTPPSQAPSSSGSPAGEDLWTPPVM